MMLRFVPVGIPFAWGGRGYEENFFHPNVAQYKKTSDNEFICIKSGSMVKAGDKFTISRTRANCEVTILLKRKRRRHR